MKRLSLIFTLLILIFFSCGKDENNPIDQGIDSKSESIQIRSDDSKDIDPRFFELKYVFNTLKLTTNYDGYVSGVDELVAHYQATGNSRLKDFESKDIFPCWYCTEADHFEALNYYTPFYELSSGDFKGVLISRKEQEVIYSVIMTDELSKAMSAFEQEDIPVYVDKVFDFFRGGTKDRNFKDYSRSRNENCLLSEANGECFCEFSSKGCIDKMGNHDVGALDCLPTCGGAPGSSSSGVGTSDPYDGSSNPSGNGGPGSCYFCDSNGTTGSESGGSGSGGGSDSQFDFPERLGIVSDILYYIHDNTSIYLNLGNQLALSNESHFDYTTYLLYTNMENMTEGQIEAYIQLITNNRHFIIDEATSQILLFNEELCNSLNSFLLANNSSDESYEYGRVITLLSQFYSISAPTYNWETMMAYSQPLYDLNISFSNVEIEHILTFEPELINDMQAFLVGKSGVELTLAKKVIHDFLKLQQCESATSCVHTNYDNEFELIYNFYSTFSPNSYDWLNTSDIFMGEYGIDLSIQDFIQLISGDCQSCTNYDSFKNYAAKKVAVNKHNYLLTNYLDYANSAVNIDLFISQYGADTYLASATLYESYMDEIGEAPDDAYQWKLAMEVFQEELLPILLEFTPGIGDLIGSYNDFKAGNYFWGCVGIISVLVPGDEIIKVIRKADNIRDAWKKVKKIFTLWNKLFSTIGGQKILNKMPQSWKDLPGSKLANGNGLFWKNGTSNLRVMDANPTSPFASQQVKYARLTKNGSRLDINGVPVPSTLPGNIPNPDFEELTHLPLSGISDDLLDLFFN